MPPIMPAPERRPLLVVIPAYNEAETIEEVATRCLVHADVCVVNDCSTDDTAALAGAIDGVHVVSHTQNTHIAGALLDGMRYAREQGYAHCVTMAIVCRSTVFILRKSPMHCVLVRN